MSAISFDSTTAGEKPLKGNPTTGAIYVEVLSSGGGSSLSPVTTATLSNVSGNASNVTLLAANANRKRLVIYNDSTAKLYIKFGATATSASFTFALNAYETYESPIGNVYLGIIDGIWTSATGAARVTEMV